MPFTKDDHVGFMDKYKKYMVEGIDKFELWKLDRRDKDEEYNSEPE
eukprot:CAMPEP_0205801750 /NCGR_PEP_ID=MMETSP0205-20121125/3842_1 /ASSEMBLY_ACC=CAM_ASM_000278 /TAXON_ID=36767 /ORGANISM="Euplotes focardii, Strain TN1" /LENGTH=45 /DNA_ID= /DNA_START= /DNA_END= /DNA_ORIENTATION=